MWKFIVLIITDAFSPQLVGNWEDNWDKSKILTICFLVAGVYGLLIMIIALKDDYPVFRTHSCATLFTSTGILAFLVHGLVLLCLKYVVNNFGQGLRDQGELWGGGGGGWGGKERGYAYYTTDFSAIQCKHKLDKSILDHKHISKVIVLLWNIPIHYIDTSVWLGSILCVKLERNYIWDSRDIFSLSSLVRVSVTSFYPFMLLTVTSECCLYNELAKKLAKLANISWRFRDMHFISSW